MSISFNTSWTHGTDSSVTDAATIPAGVLAGDVMVVGVTVFCETASGVTAALSGGSAGSWTQVSMTSGVNPEVSTAGSTIWSYGFVFTKTAAAGDPGATLTATASGSGGAGVTWMNQVGAAYTGANTASPADVCFGGNAQGTQTATAPSGATVTANDWAVYIQLGGNGQSPTYSTGTLRSAQNTPANVSNALYDSNGTVAAGTTIGGGTWTGQVGSNNWFSMFTLGLAPASSGAAPPAAPLTPPGRSSPMTWRWHTGPTQAPVLTPVSDSDTGSGADSGSVTVLGGAPVPPLTPPGRSSPMAFRFQAGPTGAPVLVPVSDSDSGAGTDSATAGTPVQAWPVTPPGRQSPLAWQFQARPSQAPVLTPVSDSDSGTGADSAYAGTPVQAFPVTPPGRSGPQAWQYQANPSQAPLLVPVSDADSGTGADSAAAGTPVQAWPLTPPGRVSPMAARFQAFPAAVPVQVYVSDSDAGTGADTGSVSAGGAAGVLLTPPGRQNPAAFWFQAATPPPVSIIAVSDSDAGTGADSAYAGTPVQAFPVTPPGRGNPQAPQFQRWPSDAPVLVPVSDADSGTGTDAGSVVVISSQPGAPLTPPGPFSPMNWRHRAAPARAPASQPGGTPLDPYQLAGTITADLLAGRAAADNYAGTITTDSYAGAIT